MGLCGQYHREGLGTMRGRRLCPSGYGEGGEQGRPHSEQLLMWRVEEGVCQVACRMAGCREVGSVGAIECERADVWVRDLGGAQLGDSSILCGLD